jgi:hypothetical protein
MGCITKLLESGAKRTRPNSGSYVEGGGVYKGYEYLVVLNHNGHRCGYVAIDSTHPLHQCESYDDPRMDIDVHGGVTFFETQPTESSCTDKWIGFDCGHHDDLPDLDALEKADPERAADVRKYRAYPYDYEPSMKDFSYVEHECKRIIEQVAV